MESYGIALGGGGARGGYEIGVWKALKELGIPISAVAGTSVGALNGAIIVQDDFDTAYSIWTSVTAERIIKFNKDIYFKSGDKRNPIETLKLIKEIISSGGLDTSPLAQLLKETINEEKIMNSQTDFGIVTFALKGFKPVRLYKENIPKGRLVDFLLASSCFPAFKPYEIENTKFIDGGFGDNIPISMLVEKGIKNIIAVDISGPGRVRKVETKGLNIVYIKNSDDLGGILDFDGERSKRNIELGYYDAMKAFGKLCGKKYCFAITSPARPIVSTIYPSTLDREGLKALFGYLGLDLDERMSSKDKFVTYRIIRAIQQYASKPLDGTNTLPAMAEICAEQVGIERFRIYSYDELVGAIIQQYEKTILDEDFTVYAKLISRFVLRDSSINFDANRNTPLINRKYLVFFRPDIYSADEKLLRFRKLISITFPKIAAANLFLSYVLSKKTMAAN